jgi:hypothetical protein
VHTFFVVWWCRGTHSILTAKLVVFGIWLFVTLFITVTFGELHKSNSYTIPNLVRTQPLPSSPYISFIYFCRSGARSVQNIFHTSSLGCTSGSGLPSSCHYCSTSRCSSGVEATSPSILMFGGSSVFTENQSDSGRQTLVHAVVELSV